MSVTFTLTTINGTPVAWLDAPMTVAEAAAVESIGAHLGAIYEALARPA